MPSFSQFLLDVKEQRRRDIILRNKWMIRIRWLYIILLTIVALVTTYLAGIRGRTLAIYTALSSLGLLINGCFWLAIVVRSRANTSYFRAIAALQVTLDIVLASSVIFLQGGLMSRATFLYAIPLLIAGILFTKNIVYVTATFCSLMYVFTLLAHSFMIEHTYTQNELLVPLAFYPSAFMLLASIIARFSALNASDERERTYQQLLAMLRHQLHHPSSVVAAIIEMLEHSETRKNWSDKDKQYLDQLKRENLRLNTMITNVLQSASEPGPTLWKHPDKVNMLELVHDVALSCAMGAKRLDDLVTELPHEHIELDADSAQLRTAIDNVVENAFHYSPKGTPVTVSLKRDTKKGTITLKVIDKGPGMSKEDQKSLFKLFTRLEEQAGTAEEDADKLYSTGLGLYVSKVIFGQHHGEMQLISEPGKGTSVIIEFKEELWLRPEFYT